MTDVYDDCRKSVLNSTEGENLADKCRERLRRRISMRRVSVRAGANQKCRVKTTTYNILTPSTAPAPTMNLNSNMETPPEPVYGSMSVIGRQRQMVNKVSIRTNLCRPEINRFQPVHFFGVFDGHVSTLCKQHMHVTMEQELMRVKVARDESNGGEERWRLAVNRSFQRMEEMGLKSCQCREKGSNSGICRCNAELMGSPAVVFILTKELVVVANCGEPRAVLCREGQPVPLSGYRKVERNRGGKIVSQAPGYLAFYHTI